MVQNSVASTHCFQMLWSRRHLVACVCVCVCWLRELRQTRNSRHNCDKAFPMARTYSAVLSLRCRGPNRKLFHPKHVFKIKEWRERCGILRTFYSLAGQRPRLVYWNFEAVCNLLCSTCATGSFNFLLLHVSYEQDDRASVCDRCRYLLCVPGRTKIFSQKQLLAPSRQSLVLEPVVAPNCLSVVHGHCIALLYDIWSLKSFVEKVGGHWIMLCC